MKTSPLRALPALLLLTSAWPAKAAITENTEEMYLGEMPTVVTATLTERKAIEVPASVTVFTEDQIKDMGVRNLVELLEKANGITERRTHLVRMNTIIRGIGSDLEDRYQIMIDGHPLSNVYNNSVSAMYNIDLDNVKQVEIVRGPGSALYGTNAFLATVNVITHAP